MGRLPVQHGRIRYRRAAGYAVAFLAAWTFGSALLRAFLLDDSEPAPTAIIDHVPAGLLPRKLEWPESVAPPVITLREPPNPATGSAQPLPPEPAPPIETPVAAAKAEEQPETEREEEAGPPPAPLPPPAAMKPEAPAEPPPATKQAQPKREPADDTDEPPPARKPRRPRPLPSVPNTPVASESADTARTEQPAAPTASPAPQPPAAAPITPAAMQVPAPAAPTGVAPIGTAAPNVPGLVPASCSSCAGGGGLLSNVGDDLPAIGGCSCCGAGPCVPGRKPCAPCDGATVLGRFFCGVYQCICCPDPCYEPRWKAVANAAYFVDQVRPQTQQRLRWDAGYDLLFPDRAEFFWPRADGLGTGPFVGGQIPVPYRGEKRVNYSDMSLYTEIAASLISFFFEMPYRSEQGALFGHAAGFSDMNLGTKSLLYDCELFQVALQFRTYLPTGNFSKGLGAGHVTLEPSLLLGLNVSPDSYFQGQVAEWIPFGGNPGYPGAILHYHCSFNHVLCRPLPDVPLIGTMEFNGWSFQSGSYTDPYLGGLQNAGGGTYLSLGPGWRLVICDRIDFGFGTAFAITRQHWADELFRSEFRWRF